MDKSIRLSFLLVTLLAIGLWGCSSDDDNTGTGPGGGNNNTTVGPDLSAATIEVPSAMQAAANANPGGGAAIAISYITQVNALTTFVTYFTPPTVAPDRRHFEHPGNFAAGTNDSVTWTDGQVSVTVVTNPIPESVTTFKVILDGSSGGVTYNNFEYISGYFFPDGSEGDFNVYQPSNPSDPITRWSWLRDPNNKLAVYYEAPSAGMLINVNVNSDGSGDISYSFNSNVEYAATWAVNGSGSWWYFDSQGGLIDSGTWQ